MFNGNPVTDGITNSVDVRKQRGLEIAAIAISRNQTMVAGGFPANHNGNLNTASLSAMNAIALAQTMRNAAASASMSML